MKTMHPGFADELEQWPDGEIVIGLLGDVDITVPEGW
jgi:hypothetical protein